MVDSLCRERAQAERWVPKAGLPGGTFDLRVVAIAAAVYLLVAAALVAIATRRAFRGDRGPARAQEVGV